jgi:hypothetical protein
MFDPESPSTVLRLHVLRFQVGASMDLELLSGDWCRLVTHFYTRTFLCAGGEECDACSVLPSRCYWYLPVLVLETNHVALLELSPTASADLEQKVRFCGYSVSPGVQVVASRRTKKSPLRFEVFSRAETPKVCRPHEWISPLMAVYKLPPLHLEESLSQYGTRVHPMVVERAKLAAAFYKAACVSGDKSRRLP